MGNKGRSRRSRRKRRSSARRNQTTPPRTVHRQDSRKRRRPRSCYALMSMIGVILTCCGVLFSAGQFAVDVIALHTDSVSRDHGAPARRTFAVSDGASIHPAPLADGLPGVLIAQEFANISRRTPVGLINRLR